MKPRTPKKLGLYIHLPFCKTICAYCAFPAFANKQAQISEYANALIREITTKGARYRKYQVDSIYFGGGTPSLPEPAVIEQILSAIKAVFVINKGCEISLEANPESLSAAKIDEYRRMGINRLSVGIQCLDNQALWKLARPHTAEIALQALKILNESGWKNFGCDLIIGLPYQTLASFKKNLQTITRYHPAHISTYFLSYDTPKIDSFIQESPGEDEQIAMYQYANKYLTQKGFKHYEVSNYALLNFECHHNLKYWNRQEYLGLGLGAHSFIGDQVSENQDNFEKYLSNPLSPKEQFKLKGELATADYIMLALRKKTGINLREFTRAFGSDSKSEILKNSENYLKSEHLTRSATNLSATLKGWLILDKITRDLI